MEAKTFVGKLQPLSPRVPYLVRHCITPGPGQYEIKSVIGNAEKLSPRRTEPSFTIHHQYRDDYLKTYMTSDLNAKMPRMLTKKCDWVNKYGIGQQSLSQNSTEPSYGFGTSTRDHRILVAQVANKRSPRSNSPRSGSPRAKTAQSPRANP